MLDKEAPPLLVGKWINTEPVTLEQYLGKVVLLQIGVLLPNYSRDLELTQTMTGKYADQGLEVIAIHQPLDITWAGEITEDDIAEYISSHNIIYPFGIDENTSGNGATYSLYDVKATPALYLIDKDGFIRISPKRDELYNWIDQLLAE
ncbi:MAG: peroxiredoxin family protein [Planctomycetota bacterium]